MKRVFKEGQRVRLMTSAHRMVFGDGFIVEPGHEGTVSLAGTDMETQIAYVTWDGDPPQSRWGRLRELEAIR